MQTDAVYNPLRKMLSFQNCRIILKALNVLLRELETVEGSMRENSDIHDIKIIHSIIHDYHVAVLENNQYLSMENGKKLVNPRSRFIFMRALQNLKDKDGANFTVDEIDDLKSTIDDLFGK